MGEHINIEWVIQKLTQALFRFDGLKLLSSR